MSTVRTRIAPSPTGQDLHIGNAYTALINYVFAKKHNGQFIIRVEDTDRRRLVKDSEERIVSSIQWLGISYDEGPDIGGPYAPYRQSERLASYKKHAEKLLADGNAYWCSCTPGQLADIRKRQEADHQPTRYDGHCRDLGLTKGLTIRLKVPREGKTTFHDLIRGDISFENNLIDDQVLLKSDGFPTYHLGVVVDDHIMQITHIIRGEEWISSTPKHILLYQFFGWELPQFAHLSVLRNPDKSKLSKRKNPVWVSDYREKGYLAEAIKNYFGTLAWAFPDGRDIFSVEEMIQKFNIEDIQTTAPVFNPEKLRWMNGEYLRMKTDTEIIKLITDFYPKQHLDARVLQKIVPLIKERMKLLSEFEPLAGFFFGKPKIFERPLKKDVLAVGNTALSSCDWNHDAMEKAIRDTSEKAGMKARDVFMELRVAVTGKTVGPPLLESMEILGKEETLARL